MTRVCCEGIEAVRVSGGGAEDDCNACLAQTLAVPVSKCPSQCVGMRPPVPLSLQACRANCQIKKLEDTTVLAAYRSHACHAPTFAMPVSKTQL